VNRKALPGQGCRIQAEHTQAGKHAHTHYQPEASRILMVASIAYPSTLMMEPAHSSEIPVNFH
jgi:hypothetical protein